MPLRRVAIQLAAANPGSLREAVMDLVSGIKYNRLLPGLEALFPGEKASRILLEFWPNSDGAQEMFDETLSTAKVTKWAVVDVQEGEHTVYMDPWGSGGSPDTEEHYFPYEYPSKISVQAKATLPAPQLAKIIAAQGRGRPTAKQLLAFLRDPVVAGTLAQVLQKECNEWLHATDQEMFADTLWDQISSDVDDYIEGDHMDVTLQFDSITGRSKAVPDGRGGLLLTIHAKIMLTGEVEEGDMPELRMPSKLHGPSRV